KIVHERRLDQAIFTERLEKARRDLASSLTSLDLDTDLFGNSRNSLSIPQIRFRNTAVKPLARGGTYGSTQGQSGERSLERDLTVAEGDFVQSVDSMHDVQNHLLRHLHQRLIIGISLVELHH